MDDIRNFCWVAGRKPSDFWKADNGHSKQNLHFTFHLKNYNLWFLEHHNVTASMCSLQHFICHQFLKTFWSLAGMQPHFLTNILFPSLLRHAEEKAHRVKHNREVLDYLFNWKNILSASNLCTETTLSSPHTYQLFCKISLLAPETSRNPGETSSPWRVTKQNYEPSAKLSFLLT